MFFIGQNHIINQLKLVLRDMHNNPHMGVGILLVGPSGYGKTTLAISICEYLAGKKFEYHLGTDKTFPLVKRVCLIDEIHKMADVEVLYPILDRKQQVIVMTTNRNGGLPEALRNRCEEYIFTDYDDDELLLMAREVADFSVTDENLMKLVEAANRNPRILKRLVKNFSRYFEQNPQINSGEVDFTPILMEVFHNDGGLDTICMRYLEILDRIGGNSSLTMLSNILHVDKEVLTDQVEPILLQKGLITISSRGRKLL